MVKLHLIFTAGLSAFTGLVAASSCENGLKYCGYNLLHKGNYYNEIVAELQKNGQGVDPDHVSQSLFQCAGSGWIGYSKYCGSGCHNGGSGRSDWCN
ncbi:MAG: hypothetical protein L6R38_003749 [Xanthoria sp. 2 TBL-2021]|nr:MAG: hypothetical protein L6R38_003749 [Xanthoria sp. 2 TBL-2021]